MENTINTPQFGRVKGAEWFPYLYKKDILVLGQGGIGSWVSVLLSRIGCTLHLYDHDIYEEHNLSGQCVMQTSISKNKAVAMEEFISNFSPAAEIYTNGKYESTSPTNEIVICGFDNMTARKTAFINWKNFVLTYEFPENCLFIDGRLNSEYMQIFTISGTNKELIEKYEKEYLFADSEVEEQDCTFKQTSHCAAMIGAYITSILTNWAFNQINKAPIRKVPFMFDCFTPLMLINHVV